MSINIEWADYVCVHPMVAHHPHYQNIYKYPPQDVIFSSNPGTVPFFEEYIGRFPQKEVISSKSPNSHLVPTDKICAIPTFLTYFGPARYFGLIEDYTTLFYPFIHNGSTSRSQIFNTKWLTQFQELLAQINFLGVLTHMKSTIKHLVELMPDLSDKFYLLPLAYPKVDLTYKKKSGTINLLFLNSYGAPETNFKLRGGIESLFAFKELIESGEDLHLRICGQFDISQYGELHDFIHTSPNVSIEPLNFISINGESRHKLSEERLHEIFLDTDILLLPAARIHSISLIRAISYGIPVIASDGWGFAEYLIEGYTGYLAKGQDKVTTWEDKILIENYSYDYPFKNDTLIDNIKTSIQQTVTKLHQMQTDCLNYAENHLSIDTRNYIFNKILEGWGA